MSPLVATKPFTPAAVLVKESNQQDVEFDRDGWLEKVFAAQEQHAEPTAPCPPKCNIIQRTLTNLSLSGTHKHHRREAKTSEEPQSYSEELSKYIAESNANLRDEEPQSSSDEDSSDDTDEELLDSVKTDDYVVPPVEVPSSYRRQDHQGGMLVAGNLVTFTNWAFKRQLRQLERLSPIPERGETELPPVMDEAEVTRGVYSGKIVEL